MHPSDVLIIGGGLAGLSCALQLAERYQVTVLAKRELEMSSSQWAQGGIAAVLAEGDSFDAHVHDTMVAGAMLNDLPATRFVVEHGPEAIAWLRAQGVPFDTAGSSLHLTREGGHSQRRIAHVADATGAAVQRTLLAAARAHPRITLLENLVAVDLITNRHMDMADGQRCWGAYALNTASGRVETFAAAQTVLATGGAGKVYLYTTNPDTATGDGIAMAWRAGCRVANMEFIQFHPTCLYHPQAKSYLISEALRGEGGILRLPDGTRFMPAHDERAELAPRDVVARAIDFEMKKHGLDCVFLDMTHKSADFLIEHFPNIHAHCLEFGIDLTRDPIPVVPAAHYTCGGVVTNLAAKSDLPGLYVVGESACTGLHGANRLASNSLLECLVFSEAAAADILATPKQPRPKLPAWDESRVADADEEIVISHNWEELRRFMWDYVGIVRTNKRLARAQHRIRLLEREIDEYYANFRVSNDLIELRNLVLTAHLIVSCAQRRHESRGLHFSRDYPQLLARARDTVLKPPRRP
ncbi:L-aspartate oxidase [mine drainage metagenome]|uniref:L-aspartate oxidase n=1 Tax=mine drainage metagenome TaxID=410659 RepID=A0A1J5S6B3_9ZZZZ